MPTTPTASFSDINLNFRPRSYFWPLDLRTHVLSSIKGAERRSYVERMFDEGRERELPADIINSALHPEDRRAAGASHPWFMGGEYLPDQRRREVEIARITIASVTQDVTSVYAHRTKHRILYRVVDEYDGGTLRAKTTRSSKQPLTLVQLADFFLGGWNLLEVLEMNCLGEPGRADEARAFFRASSEFYPGFRHLIEQRVKVWLQEQAHLSGRRLRSDLPAQMFSAITSAGVRCITPMGNTIARKGNIAQVRRTVPPVNGFWSITMYEVDDLKFL